MNLISDIDKNIYSAPIDDIHDTFSRPVVFYKEPNRVIISEDLNYLFAYEKDQQSTEETYSGVTGVFNVRIKWKDPAEADGWPDFPEMIDKGMCRLKMTIDGYNFLSGIQRFEVDGKTCILTSAKRPHGLFEINYYTIYLTETT